MADSVGGGCLCKAIRFEYDAAPNWIVHCHCESCRRATSSPMTTFVSVPRGSLRFTRGQPRYFASSPGVRRGFCADCGSPMSYESDSVPDEVHLYAASFDNPAVLAPSRHVFAAERLPWMVPGDGLPRYATTSRDGALPTVDGG